MALSNSIFDDSSKDPMARSSATRDLMPVLRAATSVEQGLGQEALVLHDHELGGSATESFSISASSSSCWKRRLRTAAV